MSSRQWIADLCAEVTPLAIELGLEGRLEPIQTVLHSGNQAMRWLKAVEAGQTIAEAIQAGITEMIDQEQITPRETGALG